MKEKITTRRLENEDIQYEWIIMNMTDTANGDTRTNGIWNSPIINLYSPTQGRLLEGSKLKASKSQRPEDRRLDQGINRSNSHTTALHSECTIKHKNRKIEIFWKLNHYIQNWLFYRNFAFLSHFAFRSKNFIILGIFTNILLSKFYKSRDFYKYLVILRQSWTNVKSLEISRKFSRPGSTD